MRPRTLLGIPVVAALAVGIANAGDSQPVPDRIQRVEPTTVFVRGPYMGVSCEEPNEFACDRACLAVHLRESAAGVDAEIAGRKLALDDRAYAWPTDPGKQTMFTGCLQPAGLIDGPLRVTADDGPGRWIGREPVSASVAFRIAAHDGTTTETESEVDLSAGWG